MPTGETTGAGEASLPHSRYAHEEPDRKRHNAIDRLGTSKGERVQDLPIAWVQCITNSLSTTPMTFRPGDKVIIDSFLETDGIGKIARFNAAGDRARIVWPSFEAWLPVTKLRSAQ